MQTLVFISYLLGIVLQELFIPVKMDKASESKTVSDRHQTYSLSEQILREKKQILKDTTFHLQLLPNHGKWEAKLMVYNDLDYNNLLTRYSGWNGGDGCYSEWLPDGSILWTFQDSFFGDITPDRNRKDNQFVHNAGLIQVHPPLQEFRQLNPVKEGKAQTWIKYDTLEEDKNWYWTGAGVLIQNRYYKLLGHTQRTGSGAWDFKNVSTDIAVFSYPEFKLLEIIRNKTLGDINYGSGIYESPDGYYYLYGTCTVDFHTSLSVARASKKNFTGNWEFFTKNGWASQPDNYSIGRDISPQPNVFKDGKKYYLLSQQVLGQDIYLYDSESPTGPWINKRTLYRIPDTYDGHSIITYNACLHPTLSRKGELVISYNVNPVNFWDNFNAPGSADKYRPYFIRIFNWK